MKRILFSALLCTYATAAMAQATTPDTIAPKRSAPEIIVSAAGAVAVNAAITEALKHSIHEMRPDRTANNSFPSRHTSWAFTASTFLSNELYRHSPWWSLAAHAAASAVGADRIVRRRHYASDVVAGAALGIASTELAYWVSRKIFGAASPLGIHQTENTFRPNLAVETGANYNLNKRYCTGYSTRLRGRLPISAHWGLAASAGASFTPVKTSSGKRPLNSFGLGAGVCTHFPLATRSLAIEPTVEIGTSRLLPVDGLHYASWGFDTTAECGLSWRITRSFACRASAGYRLTTTPRALSAITVALSSVAVF